MIRIVPLSAAPSAEVEALLDAAFGADRKTRTAYKLRESVSTIPELSFAAFDDEALAGTLQSWPVALESEGRLTPLTLVGPVAVLPRLQREGIGRALTQQLMEAARDRGHDALMMIGDPEYYGRFFGFSADWTGGWELPGPVDRRRLLAYVTRPGGVPYTGRVVPDPAFASEGATA